MNLSQHAMGESITGQTYTDRETDSSEHVFYFNIINPNGLMYLSWLKFLAVVAGFYCSVILKSIKVLFLFYSVL